MECTVMAGLVGQASAPHRGDPWHPTDSPRRDTGTERPDRSVYFATMNAMLRMTPNFANPERRSVGTSSNMNKPSMWRRMSYFRTTNTDTTLRMS